MRAFILFCLGSVAWSCPSWAGESPRKAPAEKKKPAAKTAPTAGKAGEDDTTEKLMDALRQVVKNLKSEAYKQNDRVEALRKRLDVVVAQAEQSLRTLQSLPEGDKRRELKSQLEATVARVKSLSENVLKDVDSTVKQLNEMSERIE